MGGRLKLHVKQERVRMLIQVFADFIRSGAADKTAVPVISSWLLRNAGNGNKIYFYVRRQL